MRTVIYGLYFYVFFTFSFPPPLKTKFLGSASFVGHDMVTVALFEVVLLAIPVKNASIYFCLELSMANNSIIIEKEAETQK